ncbi:MAG: hypothetical protein CL467_03195 [Acidimicrobiaceae bacterium]|nr:hypothetical protein [Acidimicrobiaceae bacterium]|tara:strand:- start:404 stop:718 length:315 start_codon:yes stop_codon:yes gene_type:complete
MPQRVCPSCSSISETEKPFCPECGAKYDGSLVKPAEKTSGLGIASLVLGITWIFWLGSLLAVIFGHVALSQIQKDSSISGRGMAIAGVTLGWIGIATLLITLAA